MIMVAWIERKPFSIDDGVGNNNGSYNMNEF